MTSRSECSGRAQRGQALSLLLLLMASLVAAFLLVFDAGQTVAAKLRLVGAADAAAYSAAQWQARSLNYEAYINRAMVANEVAIAQSVSLRSWSGYMARLLQNSANVATLVPPVGAVLQEVSQVWSNIDRGIQKALPPLESAASYWNNDVLARAGEAAALLAGPASLDLASRVAQANLPDASAGRVGAALMPGDLSRWQSFTVAYRRQGDERARLREVAMNSRDGFSASRGWTLSLAPFTGIRKRGGTDLIGYNAWRGMDTLALRVPTFFSSREVPVAWGAAEIRAQAENARGNHGGSWRDNPRTSRQANNALSPRSGYQGLPGYRDLPVARRNAPTTLRFEYALALPGTAVASSDRVLGGPATVVPGEAELPAMPRFPGGQLQAASAALVTFVRPEGRRDGRLELPSLFNPYWQARLVPVSNSQRTIVATAAGTLGSPYLVLP
jgi:hypothetical protein